jgi:hypothetical protein
MKPLEQPDTFKVYMLLKQSGMMLSVVVPPYVTNSLNSGLGSGFFFSREEAEQHRTMEILRNTPLPKEYLHIFELEIPNTGKASK